MTKFEYRETLNLKDLVTSGTIGVNIYRNQEFYRKYLTFRATGLNKTGAIREVRELYCRKLSQRTFYMMVRDLEVIV